MDLPLIDENCFGFKMLWDFFFGTEEVDTKFENNN